jgi:hypothetical protein
MAKKKDKKDRKRKKDKQDKKARKKERKKLKKEERKRRKQAAKALEAARARRAAARRGANAGRIAAPRGRRKAVRPAASRTTVPRRAAQARSAGSARRTVRHRAAAATAMPPRAAMLAPPRERHAAANGEAGGAPIHRADPAAGRNAPGRVAGHPALEERLPARAPQPPTPDQVRARRVASLFSVPERCLDLIHVRLHVVVLDESGIPSHGPRLTRSGDDQVCWLNLGPVDRELTFDDWPFDGAPRTIVAPAHAYSASFAADPTRLGRSVSAYAIDPPPEAEAAGDVTPSPEVAIED